MIYRSVGILSIGMFALGLDAYVVAGILPGIARTYDVSIALAGLSVAAFTAFYALSAPVFATMFAGKPARMILCIALAVFSIANAGSALASDFGLFLATRALAGIGAGIYSPFAAASAAFLADEKHRGRVLGLILGGMSLGTVVGVPAGLFLAKHIGWQGTLWSISLLGVIAMLAILFFFPAISPPSPPSFGDRISLLKRKTVLRVVGVTFLISVASLGLYTFVAPILSESGQGDRLTTFLWAWGVGGIVGSFSIGHIIDRVKNKQRIIAYIACFLVIAFMLIPVTSGSYFFAILPFFFWGMLGWASQAPQQYTLLKENPDHGPAVVALNSSANYLGSAVGAVAGGVLLTQISTPHQLPLFAAACVVIALCLQFFIQASSTCEETKE